MTKAAITGLAVSAVFLGAVAGCFSASDAPWTLVQSSPASPSVVVQYYHGSCDHLLGAMVTSDARTVHIRVSVKTDESACDSALRVTMVRVRLGANLGARDVQGACQPAVHSLCSPSPTLPSIPAELPVVGP